MSKPKTQIQMTLDSSSLTQAGKKRLQVEVAKWKEAMALVTRYLKASS